MGVEVYDKPSGVVRGECRGGLGGAAAPNRPPSAARRAGGPSNRKREPPCPQGTQPSSQRTSPALLSLEALQRKFPLPAAQAAQTKTTIKPPCPQGTQATSQRTSPALLSLEALQRKFRLPAAQPPPQHKKSRHAHRHSSQKNQPGQPRLTIPDFSPSYPNYPKDKYPAGPPADQSPRPGPPHQSPQ